jgi:alpha-methylacyl-CoA racemase
VSKVSGVWRRPKRNSGKKSIAVSPKTKAGLDVILKLISTADVVVDPYRPGVLERLGLGPDVLERVSKGRVILARLTGFERTGKWGKLAGHDINYLALSGVLAVGLLR